MLTDLPRARRWLVTLSLLRSTACIDAMPVVGAETDASQALPAGADAACLTGYPAMQQGLRCSRSAASQALVLSGHDFGTQLFSAGDHLVFDEWVLGPTPSDPVHLIAEVQLDGAGYEVVFDPRREGFGFREFMANADAIYVLGSGFTGTGYPLMRIATSSGSSDVVATRPVKLLAIDADTLYVAELAHGSTITAFATADAHERNSASLALALDGRELSAAKAQLRNKVLWFATPEGRLYSLDLTDETAVPIARSDACMHFAVTEQNVLCSDETGLSAIDIAAHARTPALDPPAAENHAGAGALSVASYADSSVLVYAERGSWPISLFDPARAQSTPIACNAHAVKALRVSESDVSWIEQASASTLCLFRVAHASR